MTFWQKVWLAAAIMFTLAILTSPLRAELETACLSTEDLHKFLGMIDAPYKDAGNSVIVFAEAGTVVWVWDRHRAQWCWTEGERV